MSGIEQSDMYPTPSVLSLKLTSSFFSLERYIEETNWDAS